MMVACRKGHSSAPAPELENEAEIFDKPDNKLNAGRQGVRERSREGRLAITGDSCPGCRRLPLPQAPSRNADVRPAALYRAAAPALEQPDRGGGLLYLGLSDPRLPMEMKRSYIRSEENTSELQ